MTSWILGGVRQIAAQHRQRPLLVPRVPLLPPLPCGVGLLSDQHGVDRGKIVHGALARLVLRRGGGRGGRDIMVSSWRGGHVPRTGDPDPLGRNLVFATTGRSGDETQEQ